MNFAAELPQTSIRSRCRNESQTRAYRLSDSFATGFLRLIQQLFRYFHGDFSCPHHLLSLPHSTFFARRGHAFCFKKTLAPSFGRVSRAHDERQTTNGKRQTTLRGRYCASAFAMPASTSGAITA